MNFKNVAGLAALAGVLALSGAAVAQTAAEKGKAASQQQQLTKDATGTQEGQLRGFENNALSLQPYQKAAGVANVPVSGDVPVFSATPGAFISTQLSSATLEPGSNVRVYFNQKDNQTKVVAIEVIPQAEANALFQGQANKPKK